MKKLLLTSAIASALAISATAANSAAIVSLTLEDIDGDGAVSGFRFTTAATAYAPADVSFPSGNAVGDNNRFGDSDGGPLLFDTGEVGVDVFTSGFNFGGGGDFKPRIIGTSTAADGTQTADGSGQASGDITGGVLDLTALDFGGFYNSPTFYLSPQSRADFKTQAGAPLVAGDEDAPVLGDVPFTGGSSTGLDYYLDTLVDNGDGTFGFIIKWTAKIKQGSTFDSNISRWRLEGTFDTNAATSAVPVPAAVWLFGSGLLGLVGVARRKKSA